MILRGSCAFFQAAPLAHASFRSKQSHASGNAMSTKLQTHRVSLWAAMGLACTSMTAPALADGMLTTMPHGRYQCSLPGDASGAARIQMEESLFRIASASSYRSPKGRGTYIMRGKMLTFTRGPKNGERYKRVGDTALQRLNADDSLSRLLCTRVGAKL